MVNNEYVTIIKYEIVFIDKVEGGQLYLLNDDLILILLTVIIEMIAAEKSEKESLEQAYRSKMMMRKNLMTAVTMNNIETLV